MRFENKVCVITGGANGIGRCMVEEFLKAGACVAFIDTDKAAGEMLVARCNRDKLLFVPGDVTEEPALTDFSAKVIQRFGHVDCLINNACVSRKGILSGCGYDDFNYVLRLGVTAPYFLAKLFLDSFAPGAAIVNIASTRAFMSQADTESYSAAKGGIVALTHALSASLAGKVRVNSISPGWIDTGEYHGEGYTPGHCAADEKQHPAGRIGRPPDIVNMAMFLCSEDAGFITGENIAVDGGMTRLMIYHDDNGWTYHPQD